MRGAHLVQRSHAVQKPDIVTDVVVVQIGEVRVHGVVVEVDIGVSVRGLEPGVLHGHVVHCFRRRAFLLALLHRPVVPVVADGADDLFLGNHLQGVLQVLDEPVLAGYSAWFASGIVLVIVHQDEAVGNPGNAGVVEVLSFTGTAT